MQGYNSERDAENLGWAEAFEVVKERKSQKKSRPVYPFSPQDDENGGYIVFPQILFDEVMPRVDAKTWVVLCFIIRKTRGWGKELDAIAISQIQNEARISDRTAITIGLKELQGFRAIKDGRRILGYERDERLPQLIIAHKGGRGPDGKNLTNSFSLNPDAVIYPSL